LLFILIMGNNSLLLWRSGNFYGHRIVNFAFFAVRFYYILFKDCWNFPPNIQFRYLCIIWILLRLDYKLYWEGCRSDFILRIF
jgi:hypothetical protein